jgi:hypothetical protein
MRNAMVLGANGYVGKTLTDYLLNNRNYKLVKVLIKKDSRKLKSFNLQKCILDFDNDDAILESFKGIEDFFICMGSEYVKDTEPDDVLNFELPLRFAKLAKQAGVEQVILLNTPYAQVYSKNNVYHLRGKLQDALQALAFKNLAIVLVSGIRKSNKTDSVFRLICSNLLNALSAGYWHKIRPVNVHYVAKGMVKVALMEGSGINYFTTHQIKTISA